MSAGHTALMLPLCVTQNVSSDSLTQLMFRRGWGGDSYFYFCCTAGGLSTPIVSLSHPTAAPETFFFPSLASEPISMCLWRDCKSTQMLVKVHTEPVGLTNALSFFSIPPPHNPSIIPS